MVKIKIIDSIMGSGKSTFAIDMMNNNTDTSYLYITPYLDEVERIKEACEERKFIEPYIATNKKSKKKGSNNEPDVLYKIDTLHELMSNQMNIASTHNLFKRSNDVTRDILSASSYTLVLDEVMDVVKQEEISPDDVRMLLNAGWIINDNGIVLWNIEKEQNEGKEYEGEFKHLKPKALNKNLVLHNDVILFWEFPVDIFQLFDEVYILTYLFDAQVQRHYYDIHNIEYEKYSIKINQDGNREIIPYVKHIDKEFKASLVSKIDIFNLDKLNKIGDDYYALSSSWYINKKHLIKKLKNNIYNYFFNYSEVESNYKMWTTFKEQKDRLIGNGYRKSDTFVPCNARATNKHSHKKALVYPINRFLSPVLYNYLKENGAIVDQELFALSELVQWIWRSDIRNGNNIKLYIPSKRMRELLIRWLNDEI